MIQPQKKIGVLPIALASLLINPVPDDVVFYYLVQKGSLEEEWTKRFLPHSKILSYDLKTSDADIKRIAILNDSDLTQLLKTNNIESFLYTDIVKKNVTEWGKKNAINIISSQFDSSKPYENKLWFDSYLSANNIPKPQAEIFKIGQPLKLLSQGKIVLQDPDSCSSLGTYYIDNQKDLDQLIATKELKADYPYLARHFMLGTTYGIEIFISPGHVVLSAVRRQCFYPDKINNKSSFAGIQWVPSKQLSDKLISNINTIFISLGESLYKDNFLGYASFDFIVDANELIFVLECNPRFTTGSKHILRFPELVSNYPTGTMLIDAFFSNTKYPAKAQISPFPNSSFNGSFLYLIYFPELVGHPIVTGLAHQSGVYELNGTEIVFKDPDIRTITNIHKQFIYFSDTPPEKQISESLDYANIVSNFPLYDELGQINKDGNLIKNHFSQ